MQNREGRKSRVQSAACVLPGMGTTCMGTRHEDRWTFYSLRCVRKFNHVFHSGRHQHYLRVGLQHEPG